MPNSNVLAIIILEDASPIFCNYKHLSNFIIFVESLHSRKQWIIRWCWWNAREILGMFGWLLYPPSACQARALFSRLLGEEGKVEGKPNHSASWRRSFPRFYIILKHRKDRDPDVNSKLNNYKTCLRFVRNGGVRKNASLIGVCKPKRLLWGSTVPYGQRHAFMSPNYFWQWKHGPSAHVLR